MSDEASVESEGLVQLTEDLLYIVNKKLRSMDKAKRDKKTQTWLFTPAGGIKKVNS